MQDIIDQVIECATYILLINNNEKELSEYTTFEELEFDSLDRLEFIMELEYEFNIELKDEFINNCKNLKDIARVVDQIIGEQYEVQVRR